MRLSNIGQVNPVMTAATLDATLPKTELTKNTVKLGGGPDAGGLLLGLGLLILGYIFISSSPPDPRGTIRGY
jgi:hypothetical protein